MPVTEQAQDNQAAGATPADTAVSDPQQLAALLEESRTEAARLRTALETVTEIALSPLLSPADRLQSIADCSRRARGLIVAAPASKPAAQTPSAPPPPQPITKGQFESTVASLRSMAGEPDAPVEFHDCAFWVFCSELGSLRLITRYQRPSSVATQGHSANLNSHYFKLETPKVTGRMSTPEKLAPAKGHWVFKSSDGQYLAFNWHHDAYLTRTPAHAYTLDSHQAAERQRPAYEATLAISLTVTPRPVAADMAAHPVPLPSLPQGVKLTSSKA
jgi:hypothetical protein